MSKEYRYKVVTYPQSGGATTTHSRWNYRWLAILHLSIIRIPNRHTGAILIKNTINNGPTWEVLTKRN